MNQTPWTVRGIPPQLVKQVKKEAKKREMTLGEAVRVALVSWLTNPPALTPEQKRIEELEVRMERVERKLMEMQVTEQD